MPRGSISGTRSAPRVSPPPDWPNRVPKGARSDGAREEGDRADRGPRRAGKTSAQSRRSRYAKGMRAKIADLISPD